jgi:hypothetical protein
MIRNPYNPECGLCNVAFTAYAAHTEYLNSIVKRILAGEVDITVSDSVTESDLRWIEQEVEKRLG